MTTKDDRRNPYLMLGVPYGVTADVANKAFARAGRLARRGQSRFTIEDLTWALHQIEHGSRERDSLLRHFRVPADPGPYLDHVTGGLAPRPRPLPRRTEPLPDLDQHVEHEALRQLTRRLLISALSNG